MVTGEHYVYQLMYSRSTRRCLPTYQRISTPLHRPGTVGMVEDVLRLSLSREILFGLEFEAVPDSMIWLFLRQ